MEFEVGSSVLVEPFEISQLPVSIAAFARFAETTGYVTSAEKNADSESFRHNFPLSGSTEAERQSMAAGVISYLDAWAYCPGYRD
jgi:formylglycine-generating enzyme required for sulfatase activity